MDPWIQHLPARAAFAPTTMQKVECFRSDRLLLGLNCFEPGQHQATHEHAAMDKFYLVVSGKASFVIGGTTAMAGPGDLVVAPAGVPHGVASAAERTVVLVGMAPAP